MAIGIDFGTTNSSIVHHGERGATLVEVGTGLEPYPAVLRTAVHQADDGILRLGREALEEGGRNSEGLRASFKPLLNEERLRQFVLSPVTTVGTGHDFVNGGAVTTTRLEAEMRYGNVSRKDVVEASAHVLRHLFSQLRDQASLTLEEFLEEPVYIGVPVGYGPTARRRLLDALVQAGLCGDDADGAAYRAALRRVRFVYEPVALIPLADVFEPETVLVFDYGGGTLDLGVWAADPGDGDVRFRQLALGGHPRAGDELDRLLLAHLCDTRPDYAAEVRSEAGTVGYDTVRRIAEVKEALSRSESEQLQEGGLPAFEVTRDDFEVAIRGELQAIELAVEECVGRSGVGRHGIDRIVMSGGSSLTPAARSLLWRLFPAVEPARFSWPDAGDVEASRSALTGVSRGLADFGWEEQVAGATSLVDSLPGDLLVWSERARGMLELAEQGTVLNGKPISGPVNLGDGLVSIAVYERIADERLVACLEDVKVPPGTAVVVEIEPQRFGLIPKMRAKVKGEVVATLDLDELTDFQLGKLLKSDGRWSVRSGGPACGYLARPLRVGDYVRVPRKVENGVVSGIEEISSGRSVEQMESWVIGSGGYRVRVKPEENGSQVIELQRHAEVHLH